MTIRKKKSYPWADLYELESKSKTDQDSAGRPTNQVKKHTTSVTFYSEERRLYEDLTYKIKSILQDRKVTKSLVLGVALRLLDAKLKDVPSRVSDWPELAELLFGEEE